MNDWHRVGHLDQFASLSLPGGHHGSKAVNVTIKWIKFDMAEMRRSREIDEARVRETNEQVDQIKLEMENLKNENKLAKEEISCMKVELKYYRIFIFVSSLIICGAVAKYLGFLRHTEQHSARLDDVEKRVREIGINDEMQNWGEFVWPIDGWAAKMRSARDGFTKVIYSDTFYSHKNGYKMCLSVWPDGFGNDKGTHLTVFFFLMRGPFDNILSWPFKHAVTLSLINQDTGNDQFSHTIITADLPNHFDRDKPKNDRNRGLALLGSIKLTELSSIPGLCRDDKIFIRCTVK